MYFKLFHVCLLSSVISGSGFLFDFKRRLSCPTEGKVFNTTLRGYYNSPDDAEYKDVEKQPLRSLQVYLEEGEGFVSVAVDPYLEIPYGTKICIPSLNEHYGMNINFEVRDVSGLLMGKGFEKINIFVKSEMESFDKIFNSSTKIVLLLDELKKKEF